MVRSVSLKLPRSKGALSPTIGRYAPNAGRDQSDHEWPASTL